MATASEKKVRDGDKLFSEAEKRYATTLML